MSVTLGIRLLVGKIRALSLAEAQRQFDKLNTKSSITLILAVRIGAKQ